MVALRALSTLLVFVFGMIIADSPDQYESNIAAWCQQFEIGCPAWVTNPAWGLTFFWLFFGVALLAWFGPFILRRARSLLAAEHSRYVDFAGATEWLYKKSSTDFRAELREGASISDGGDVIRYGPSIIAFWAQHGGGRVFGQWHEGGPIEQITYRDIERDIFNEAFNEKGNPRPVEFFVLRSDLKRLKEYYEQDPA